MEENKLEIHYIQGDELRPFGISAHTHGLEDYGQTEFELVLPYSQDDMATFFNSLIAMVVDDGRHFEEGCYTDILTDDYRMYFIEMPDFYQEGKKVLRIIYPDEEGKMPWEEGCEKHYAMQIFDIPKAKLPLFS